ncbi:MAG: DNA methyltransferase [Candidatus Borkfalkiaceae bacterium]|nr:DNA methyltransferase [Clostridia bacterium]MDY6223789.1 DNA methyltransferase [Christensenellaceae bacterium]
MEWINLAAIVVIPILAVIIFISIDDNEVYSLKYLCDEIFGSRNYLATIVVENDSRARPYNSISITHEYVLLYKKSDAFEANTLNDPNKKFKFYDDIGGFDLYELRNRNSDFNIDNRPNLYYPFWVNPNKQYDNDLYEIDLQEHEGWIKFYPQESQGIKTVWRWGKEKSQQNLNTVIFGRKAIGGWQVVKKYRESTYSLNSVWTDSKFSSDNGTLLLKKYFDNKRIFGFPKPIDLLKQCFSICLKENSIVLDSFAGSGTTAQAILDLNNQDGGMMTSSTLN